MGLMEPKKKIPVPERGIWAWMIKIQVINRMRRRKRVIRQKLREEKVKTTFNFTVLKRIYFPKKPRVK